MVDKPEPLYRPDVVHHLLRGSLAAAREAAETLDECDVVVVQHEFGIYGSADGEGVLGELDRLTVPVIVVVHTLPSVPTGHQREVLERVARRADAVVTMSMTARSRLLDFYGVDPGKVVVIPHRRDRLKQNRRAKGSGRACDDPDLGLLGPGKGIESVIDVPPDRQPLYRVVGQTHPRVLERDGKAYRAGLVARTEARCVADLVAFQASYLEVVSLSRVVAQADVVGLPYESREQVTSGVLIEAVAAGRPVVATAFPHAVELLGSGAGLVVPHGDAGALARALRRVLAEPGLAASMSGHSSNSPKTRGRVSFGFRRHRVEAKLMFRQPGVRVLHPLHAWHTGLMRCPHRLVEFDPGDPIRKISLTKRLAEKCTHAMALVDVVAGWRLSADRTADEETDDAIARIKLSSNVIFSKT